jgi:hypothetical protein
MGHRRPLFYRFASLSAWEVIRTLYRMVRWSAAERSAGYYHNLTKHELAVQNGITTACREAAKQGHGIIPVPDDDYDVFERASALAGLLPYPGPLGGVVAFVVDGRAVEIYPISGRPIRRRNRYMATHDCTAKVRACLQAAGLPVD